MPSITDVRLKVSRAEAHLDTFKAAANAGKDASPVAQGIYWEDGHLKYRTMATPITTEHGIMLGDVIHQLRAALDHLLFLPAARLTTDQKVLRQIQFPISIMESEYKDSRSLKALRRLFGASAPVLDELRGHQPFVTHATPTDSPLWVLGELDVIDKHRTVLLTGGTVSAVGHVIDGEGQKHAIDLRKVPIVDGVAVFPINHVFTELPREIGLKVAPYIVFHETGVRDNLSVFPIIRSLFESVTKVIDAFEAKHLV
ncbi:MAG: hypothetical protein ABL986_17890 [Vicinamibacterales bacterium]